MDLEEMLNKIKDLNNKEDFVKKTNKDEKSFNIRKDYKEARERFEKEIEDPRVKNIIKIFQSLRELPSGWDYASKSHGVPKEFQGKKLYKMLIPEYRATDSRLNEDNIVFCVDGETINGVTDSFLCYRWQTEPTYDSNGVFHKIYDFDKTFVCISVINKIDRTTAYVTSGNLWYNMKCVREPLDIDDLDEEYMERRTITLNRFCDKLDGFIEEASSALAQYINEKEFVYGNVDINEKSNLELKRFENELNKYTCYCKTDDRTYYLSEDGETLFSVDQTLTIAEAVALMKNAMEYNIEDEKAKVYVFATDNRNRERLESLWQDYIDDEDTFVEISEEFEDGVEQYKEELGIDNELEL